jgi:quercetin dioxygenase-like cupin family protein
VTLVRPGEGWHLRAGHTRPTVKVGPHLGSRRLGVMESEVLPGGGFPEHVHDEYEEAFYVLDGEIEYLVDSVWTRAVTGTTVFIRPGRVHGFRNTTDKPTHHLAITSPAIVMTMIEELTNAAAGDVPAVLARYRSRLIP